MNPAHAFWLPYTANRAFWKSPRVIRAASGHYYQTSAGDELLDGFSGLWTSGLGHCHPRIVAAVQSQVATLDYALGFQATNDKAVALAEQLSVLAPGDLDRVFFTNSGSEAVDTALKVALAYHRAKGEGGRTRLIGRERAYHGGNFGGLSVGGIGANRKAFSASLLPGIDHLRHTYERSEMAYCRGQPSWGAHLADDLERLVQLHDASSIAAVIVEPVAGSTGILVPPVGYLQRLREICDCHSILLIFDEVITAFGRVGTAFAAERFGVLPDILTVAKGITNGVIPMGAVLVRESIYQALMQGPEEAIEFFHGYTYSGHPVAAAAGLAALASYEEEESFRQAKALELRFEEALHGLREEPHVVDIRNIGLMGGIELASREGAPGVRGFVAFQDCFEQGVVIRNGGDTLQFAPFLNSAEDELERIFDCVRKALRRLR